MHEFKLCDFNQILEHLKMAEVLSTQKFCLKIILALGHLVAENESCLHLKLADQADLPMPDKLMYWTTVNNANHLFLYHYYPE